MSSVDSSSGSSSVSSSAPTPSSSFALPAGASDVSSPPFSSASSLTGAPSSSPGAISSPAISSLASSSHAPTSTTITIAHLDSANAHRDEKNEDYRLGKRMGQFAELFYDFGVSVSSRPDVVSIKELRTCKSLNGTKTVDAHEMATTLALAGEYAIASCDPVKLTRSKGCPTYDPFYLAQLYDPKKLTKLKVVADRNYIYVYGYDEDSPHFGACRLTVWYAPLNVDGTPDQDRQFAVTTEHYPIQAKYKLRAAAITGTALSLPAPRICIGDFNLFRDEKEHDDIYKLLTLHGKDATKELTDQHGNPMYGTFYPFPHDKMPVPIARPEENSPNASKLDYAFVGGKGIRPKKAWVLTGLQDAKGIPISDHLPLLVQVELF